MQQIAQSNKLLSLLVVRVPVLQQFLGQDKYRQFHFEELCKAFRNNFVCIEWKEKKLHAHKASKGPLAT